MATSSGVVPHVTLIDFGSAQFIPPGIDVMVDIPAGNIDFVGKRTFILYTKLLYVGLQLEQCHKCLKYNGVIIFVQR